MGKRIPARRLAGVLALALALSLAPAAEAQNWRDDDLGGAVRGGAATTEHLWLLGESGVVVRFDRSSGERVVAAGNVVDLLAEDGRLWALSTINKHAFGLRDLRSPDVEPARIGMNGAPISLFRTVDGVGVLTTDMVLVPAEDGWRRQWLPATLHPRGTVAANGHGSVYLGVNRGEWGGGLRRIDAATGAIAFVTERGEDLCGGVFNPECSPVVGVFPDPGDPACVIAGSGLAHLGLSHGLVARVCGDAITPLFSAPMPESEGLFPLPGQDWPFHSLVETSGGWLAVSDGRYFRSRDGRVEEAPLPELAEWSGLRISGPVDGVIFVMSACCWGSLANPTLHRVLAIPVSR